MKKTKIICSIGPSTQTWENFKGLVEAGMNVARINFSHATIEERKLDESLIKRANEELGANIVYILDLREDIIDFEITPNRPDCLSIEGLGRETAVALGEEFENPRKDIDEMISNNKVPYKE